MSELTNRMIGERAGLHTKINQGGTACVVDDRGYWYPEWPDYLNDVNEALTLPLDAGYRFLLFGAAGDGWHCYIENEVGAIDDRIAGQHADVPAQAVCAAWWQWQLLSEHNNTQEGR